MEDLTLENIMTIIREEFVNEVTAYKTRKMGGEIISPDPNNFFDTVEGRIKSLFVANDRSTS